MSHAPRTYRGDIDGLRAIAVLLVVVFHLRDGWMPGGFVGVDVFFVISGFVVTASLLGRDVGEGFSVVDFYARRVRRLGPALIAAILGASLLYASLVPPVPNEFNVAVFRTAMTSVFGLSNFYLLRLGKSYFDGDVLPNPFTHTWSLAVEEQFYALYPLLWWFASALAKATKTAPRRALLATVTFAGLTSLVASACWSVSTPSLAYFAMPSRFWELALGALLALRSDSIARAVRGNPRWSLSGQITGLVLVVFAGILTPSQGFPMPGAIPAAVGAALLIACGTGGTGPVSSALASGPLVYLGRISYSLYLWHWPAIAIATRLHGEGTTPSIVAALALTVLGTLASHHLVESPVRHAAHGERWRPIVVGLAVALVACLGVDQLRRHRFDLYLGSHQRWSTDWAVDEGALVEGKVAPRVCHLTAGASVPRSIEPRCRFRAQAGAPYRLWSFGDSHAFANWPMLLGGLARREYDLYVFSHDGCEVRGSNPGSDSCGAYWNHVREVIRREASPGDVVMLSAFLRSYRIDAPVRRAVAELRAMTASRGATLLVQAPLPVQGRHAFDCIETPYSTVPEACRKPRERDLRERSEAASFVAGLARERGVAVWDPYDLLCPGPFCTPFLDGRPVFRDDDHLSLHGSRGLVAPFLAALRRARAAGD